MAQKNIQLILKADVFPCLQSFVKVFESVLKYESSFRTIEFPACYSILKHLFSNFIFLKRSKTILY